MTLTVFVVAADDLNRFRCILTQLFPLLASKFDVVLPASLDECGLILCGDVVNDDEGAIAPPLSTRDAKASTMRLSPRASGDSTRPE